MTRQISGHQSWDSRRIPSNYNGYSCLLVVISGSIKNPQPQPPTQVVDRGSGGQLRHPNGLPTGAIESAARIDGASVS